VKWNSNGNERGRLTQINSSVPVCALGKFTWLKINMDDHGPVVWAAQETNLVHECGAKGAKILPNVPYINQRYDTGDSFDGSWACGPTSTLMALAALKKISAKSISCSQPWAHTNEFGYYDSAVYTSPTGFKFDKTMPDPKGHAYAGAWGSCTKEGGAWAYLIQDFVVNHGGLTAVFHDAGTCTLALTKQSIDAGKYVIQSTQIRGAGHLVLVHGYTSDGRLVVNDPWGDANGPNWGKYPNGEKVLYTQALLAAKWCVIVGPKSAGEEYVHVPAPAHVWTKTRRPSF